MGCWGFGIFDDDLALDIRDLYNEVIMKDDNDLIATATVMQLFKESVDSEDDGIIIFTALSCIQLSRSNLFTEIKERTIELINSNSGMARWEEAGKTSYQKKRAELNKLKVILVQAKNVKTYTKSEILVPEDYTKSLKFSVYQLSKNNETKYIGSTAFPEKRFRYMNLIEFEKSGILQRLFKRTDNKENEFWNWFSNNELEIYNSKNIEDKIINELSVKLKKINEGLVFEFSGILDDKRTIAISADGIGDVFPDVIKLTNEPKLLTKWIVVPFMYLDSREGNAFGYHMVDYVETVKDAFFNSATYYQSQSNTDVIVRVAGYKSAMSDTAYTGSSSTPPGYSGNNSQYEYYTKTVPGTGIII